jgi:F0F1-type ATP synthase membrane subunit c/vacuolar-type H+-ATPase subunit K
MGNITLILLMLLSTLAPAVIIAVVGYAAVKAVGRNPAASARILLTMIVAFIFAEAIAVMAILMISNLFR